MQSIGVPILALTLLTIPVAAGMPWDGTEASPELTDAENDVAYDPKHQGGPHSYLDIAASWLEYLPANDSYLMTFKTTNMRDLDPPPADFFISCGLSAPTFLDDVRTGRLSFNFQFIPPTPGVPDAPTFAHTVHFMDEGGDESSAPLKHTFELVPAEPGYARFWVERPVLQQVGTRLDGFSAFCYENYRAAGSLPLYRNGDDAEATEAFALDHSPPPSLETDQPAESESMTSTPAMSEKTPSLGIMLTFLGLVVVVFRRRL